MIYGQTPGWLERCERRLRWIAIPNIASFLVGLQGIGLVLVLADPRWWSQLALVPQLVLEGEVWRLLTFLALPLSSSPLWMLFVLWFLFSLHGPDYLRRRPAIDTFSRGGGPRPRHPDPSFFIPARQNRMAGLVDGRLRALAIRRDRK